MIVKLLLQKNIILKTNTSEHSFHSSAHGLMGHELKMWKLGVPLWLVASSFTVLVQNHTSHRSGTDCSLDIRSILAKVLQICKC